MPRSSDRDYVHDFSLNSVAAASGYELSKRRDEPVTLRRVTET